MARHVDRNRRHRDRPIEIGENAAAANGFKQKGEAGELSVGQTAPVPNDGVCDDSTENLFDGGIRRRSGELINQVARRVVFR